MQTPETIPQRLAAIEERILQACQRAGRRREEVTLVGVSKLQPLTKLQEAWEAGLRVFGENRVQEAEDKVPHMPDGVEWHLIGPLQSNKTKRAAQLFQVVHSVDRLKIARRLDRDFAAQEEEARPEAKARRLRCFLEVNLGEEESKHGFSPSGILEAAPQLREFEHLEIVGLMAIPPQPEEGSSDPDAPDPEAQARGWFRRLAELRDQLLAEPGWEKCPGWLSMGMSADFEIAIEEGATHVRVGTALFGPRPAASPESGL
ncbi:MAG: YggS family pyridoxal phosphate-dependent enzyme [Acidobacteriota bacterium]|nr:YggS family pyridoxal phosphate-dependent enzyme [Acidobacteriota bacterium]